MLIVDPGRNHREAKNFNLPCFPLRQPYDFPTVVSEPGLKEFSRRGGSRSVTCDEVLTLTPCGPGGRVGHVETQTVKLALRYTWWSPCGDRKGTKWD